MPNFTRRPTDRSDDDLRRIAEETGKLRVKIKVPDHVWTFEDGHSITFTNCEQTFYPDRGERFDSLIRDIMAAPNVIPHLPVLHAQERILNTGAEDAVVDGLVDFPL